MGLPTAQLGQMPNMQMPYNIPVQLYTKEPKAWEKLLMNIAGNVASAGITKGVENYMQPDFAPTPATGMDKFLHGPTISQSRAQELDRQFSDTEKADAEARNQRLNRMVEMTGQNKAEADRLAGLTNMANTQAGQLQMEGERNDMSAENLRSEAAHRRLQDLVAQRTANRQDKLTDAQTKDLEAQTKLRTVESKQKATQDWIMRHGRVPRPEDFGPTGELLDVQQKPTPLPGLPGSTPTGNPAISASVPTEISDAVKQRLLGGGYPDPYASKTASSPAPVDEISRRMGITPAAASTTAQSSGIPPEVQQAASVLANGRAGAYADTYRAVIAAWLDNNGQGQPWSEDNVSLRKLISQ